MSDSERMSAIINLDNLEHNLNEYKRIINNNSLKCAVIKANAYGHGAREVSRFLEDKVDYFAVSSADEALEIREAGVKSKIMILGYVSLDRIKPLIKHDIELCAYNTISIEDIYSVCKLNGLKAKIHLALDTGMNRIGFGEEDYLKDTSLLLDKGIFETVGVFSHFSKASTPDMDYTKTQYELFLNMVKNLEELGHSFKVKHISNTAGGSWKNYNLDMVRIGLGLFGYSPYGNNMDGRGNKLDLKPVMILKSLISHVKLLSAGKQIGYDGVYKTTKDEWIATVPMGYADGFSKKVLKEGSKFLIKDGQIGTVVGNVCMDQLMIRLDKKADARTTVFLFGEDERYTAETLANEAGTIVYEVLCNIQRRVPRIYTYNGRQIGEVSYLE